jgi:hypothetical protein
MDDPLSVQVPDSLDHLPEHELGLMLGKSFPRGLFDAFKKVMRRSSPRGGFVGLLDLAYVKSLHLGSG